MADTHCLGTTMAFNGRRNSVKVYLGSGFYAMDLAYVTGVWFSQFILSGVLSTPQYLT